MESLVRCICPNSDNKFHQHKYIIFQDFQISQIVCYCNEGSSIWNPLWKYSYQVNSS